MTLGQKISRLRKLKGLTQGEIANRLNIHQSMVTRWERDQVQPKSDTLKRLAEALETSIEELLDGDEVPGAKKSATIRGLHNRQLAELLSQVSELDEVDQQALAAVLDAMLTKRRIQDMVSSRKSA